MVQTDPLTLLVSNAVTEQNPGRQQLTWDPAAATEQDTKRLMCSCHGTWGSGFSFATPCITGKQLCCKWYSAK